MSMDEAKDGPVKQGEDAEDPEVEADGTKHIKEKEIPSPSQNTEAAAPSAEEPDRADASSNAGENTEDHDESSKQTDENVESGSPTKKRAANDDELDEPTPDILKPVKRARSAYFIFADEKRSAVQQQHPGQTIAVVARALGAMWSSMTPEDKQPYQEKAAEERKRVETAVEAWKAAGGSVPEPAGSVSLSAVDLPVARVKKICKLDPEVKNLTKEGLWMVTKAAELVLVKLGKECVKTAQIQNRRKLLPDDLAQVCSVREQFLFLREDIQDLHRSQQRETDANKVKTSKKEVVKAGKPITDFFKTAS